MVVGKFLSMIPVGVVELFHAEYSRSFLNLSLKGLLLFSPQPVNNCHREYGQMEHRRLRSFMKMKHESN